MVEMYIIRDKNDPNMFMSSSKYGHFSDFRNAILNGCYYNQRKSAEKILNSYKKEIEKPELWKRAGLSYAHYTDDSTAEHGIKTSYFTTGSVDLKNNHEVHRPLELEIVEIIVCLKNS